MHRIEAIAGQSPGVRHTVAIAGQSILLNANAPNFGAMYVMLDDFHRRTSRDLSGESIAERLRDALQDEVKDGLINVFAAPPVEGLGTAGGFKIIVEDRGGSSLAALDTIAQKAVQAGSENSSLRRVYSSFRAATPWLYIDIDRQQARSMGVSMADVFNTLQVFLGSYYVNDFNRFGRTWQVNVQGDTNFRKQIEDLKQLKIRNESGGMVPLAAVANIRDVSGPVMVMRYNMYPSAAVN